MSAKRPVIVWTSRNPNADDDQKEYEQHREMEPASKDIDHVTGPPITRERSKLQVLLVTVLSAVVLGVVIGAVMLKLLTVFEADEAAVAVSGNLSGTAGAKSELLTAYVLQGGAFTKKKNAEEWLAKYKKAGIPAVLWKRDGSYYLFAGAAPAEGQAAEQAAQMQDKQLDIYVKEWTAPIAKGSLTEKEKEWLGEFSTLWSVSLQASAGKEAVSTADWRKLMRNAPTESAASQNLVKAIGDNMDKLKNGDPAIVRQGLLQIWKTGDAV